VVVGDSAVSEHLEAWACEAAAEIPVKGGVAKLRVELLLVGRAEGLRGEPSKISMWTTWPTWEMAASWHVAAKRRAEKASVETEGQAATAARAGPAELEAKAGTAATAATAALRPMHRLR
jgi:hypothetical protein